MSGHVLQHRDPRRGLEDVCYVPRRCVFFDGRSTVAFVAANDTIERREVEVGLDNAWVEIKSGLQEGEIVALAPPVDFKPEALGRSP